jgi:hypothetical protein
MKKWLLFLSALGMLHSITAYTANWVRDGKVTEKEWSDNSSKPIVFGFLTFPPPNNNECSWENDGDLALNFDISNLARLAGDSFDVNKLYIDGVGIGEVSLTSWLLTWRLNEGSRDR